MGQPIIYAQLRGRKVFDDPRDLHIIQDGSDCICSAKCFCDPEFVLYDEENECKVFTHKSFEQMCN